MGKNMNELGLLLGDTLMSVLEYSGLLMGVSEVVRENPVPENLIGAGLVYVSAKLGKYANSISHRATLLKDIDKKNWELYKKLEEIYKNNSEK